MAICKVEGCGREEKYLSKGLCNKHYAKLQRTGTLEYTPRTNAQRGVFTCSNPKCPEPPDKIKKIIRGLCKNCYYRQWHTGNVDYQVRERKPCSIEGCVKLAVSKGLCDTHRKRVDRKGSVEAGARPEWWGSYPARKERARSSRFKETYGIEYEIYERLYEEQGGVCAICGNPETRVDSRTGKLFPLAYDHNKTTGEGRGLLCGDHNTGIGLFNHDPVLMEKGAGYLRKYGH